MTALRLSLIAMAIASAIGVFAWQRHQNDTLRLTLSQTSAERDTLKQERDRQRAEIQTLASLNEQQAADFLQQLQRRDSITTASRQRAIQLESISHDPQAKDWADTRLPAAVISLLDTTTPAHRASLPFAHPLPAASPAPRN